MKPLDDLLGEMEAAARLVLLPGSWPLTLANLDRKILRMVAALRKRTMAIEQALAASDPEEIDRGMLEAALEEEVEFTTQGCDPPPPWQRR